MSQFPPAESLLAEYHSRYDIESEYDHPSNCPDRYPPDWNYRKGAILSIYDEQCGRCRSPIGQSNGVESHLHHARPLSRSGTHKLENLIPLCEECHALMHPDNESLSTNWKAASLFPDEEADPRVAVERVPTTDFERAVYDDRSTLSTICGDSPQNRWAQNIATTDVPADAAQLKLNPQPEDTERLTLTPPFEFFCDRCRVMTSGETFCNGCAGSVTEADSNRTRVERLIAPVQNLFRRLVG